MRIIEVLERMPNQARGADYEVCRVRLDDGGEAVWKPNMAAEPKSLAPLREFVAYRVDEILGTRLVPESEVICFENRVGSVQRWANGRNGAEALQGGREPELHELQKLGVFDFICSNPDRCPSNWLVKEDGSLVAIDNSGCFQNRDTFTWSMAALIGRELEPEAWEVIERAHDKAREVCDAVLHLSYTMPDGEMVGGNGELKVAAELALNHIHVLAGAAGLTNDSLEVLGLVGLEEVGL